MGKLLRIVLGSLAAAIIIGASAAMFAEPFWQELFKRLGWDTSRWVSPMLTFLTQYWVHLALTGVVGTAIGAWGHWFATKFDRATPLPIELHRDTRLRIRVASDGTFHQEVCMNIERWQQMSNVFSTMPEGAALPKIQMRFDVLALSFQAPIEYDRPVINFYGQHPPRINIYPLGTTGTALQFLDTIQIPKFEIWFPPPGYYDEVGRLNLSEDPSFIPNGETEAK